MSDVELARLIKKSTAPPDVVITVQHGILQCSTPARIVSEVTIQFARDVSVGIISAWLYDILKASGKRSTEINRSKVSFDKKVLDFASSRFSQINATVMLSGRFFTRRRKGSATNFQVFRQAQINKVVNTPPSSGINI